MATVSVDGLHTTTIAASDDVTTADETTAGARTTPSVPESADAQVAALAATLEGAKVTSELASRNGAVAFPVATWDKYEFLALLGSGGMGAVYKAVDRRLDRIVALKFIRGDDPTLVQRFLQEAHAQARLEHPNICRVYEVGQVDGKPYIAMQFIEGKPLAAIRDELALHHSVQVIRDTALALHEAHRLGIIHRDIKPTNIMVEKSADGGWRPVVMDFGLARESTASRGLTETGAVMGTPAYMPPEQARGNARHLDRRADVYALGATLYELLTARPPFLGEQVVDVILAVLSDEPTPPRSLVPEIPVDLETIVLKCLAKAPGERYDSARALADDLQRFIDGEPIQGKPRGPLKRLWNQARRHKGISFFALASVLALPVGYGVARYFAQRDLEQQVALYIGQGIQKLEEGNRHEMATSGLKARAFAAFDSQNLAEGESLWSRTQSASLDADRALAHAGRQFEAALAVDHRSTRARELLADSLLSRALLSEREHRPHQIEELLSRLAVYDMTGERRRHWLAFGHVQLRTTPVGARARLGRYEKDAQQKRPLVKMRDLGPTPIADLRLEPGSYVLILSAPGHAEIRYPFVIARNGNETFDIDLPPASQVPPGFVYIPPGAFLFGSGSDEAMRKSFLSTVPIHSVKTGAYLVSRNETTYGEWIEYLNSLSVVERAQQTAPGNGPLSGSVVLKQLSDGVWQIALQHGTQVLTAKAGEPIVYSGRSLRKQQNWLRMPVGGVTFSQAQKYTQWLQRSGRLPGARLCNEYEWERAARGADDREWPHGDDLAAREANHDVTYDKDPLGMGPDEVGTYPESRSPFGVDDLAGNVFEWTHSRLSKDEPDVRGGSYWYSAVAARSTNRNTFDPSFRDANIGIRICLTPANPI